jgi:hypothetical protein
MAQRLEEKLRIAGVNIDVDLFRDLLSDTMQAMHPFWNDEDLMHRPTEALRFCQAIREATSGYELPDEVILRALSGRRKRSL